eukprot:CAMPEP_0170474046 /NCGR_PEP_ID=MMETSP0123-20130129/15867_1 /TAXON_ID=182087 /ORGANISM="Favella ehrenbergii, Strain Fehren 1" /LENGTH=61 /DNA_ID=CAMNT_0010743505 /DNA_START=142 /DNA_END=325 /DNA_ORIENTATION=+
MELDVAHEQGGNVVEGVTAAEAQNLLQVLVAALGAALNFPAAPLSWKSVRNSLPLSRFIEA